MPKSANRSKSSLNNCNLTVVMAKKRTRRATVACANMEIAVLASVALMF